MIVCNTSPLIALSIVDRLELLDSLYGEWYAPETVARESTIDRKPFSERLAQKLQGHAVQVQDSLLADALALSLDRGEAEVIALAEERQCDWILIDDRKGRRIARLRGLSVVGTVGVLLKAKRQGLLAEVKPVLSRLAESGIRIDKDLFDRALEMAGE